MSEPLSRRIKTACDAHEELASSSDDSRALWIAQRLASQGRSATPETVLSWIAGETNATGADLKALAQALEVDTRWLSEGSPPPAPSRWEVTEWRADEAEMQDFSSEVQARAAFEKAKRELVPGANVELTRVTVLDFAERPE